MPLPVAEQWFIRRKLDDYITLITEPHVHPFLRCNIWHVRGRDRDLLIDTGMGIADLASAASDLFEKQLSVVLTHAHVDHAGGAFEFDHCCIHAAEVEHACAAEDQMSLVACLQPPEIREMMEADGPLGEFLITASPYDGFDPAAYRLRPTAEPTLVEEGDVIDLGDREFEILHLPGHSPGSIGLWEKRTGTLFSGDAVYDGNLLDELPGSDQEKYRATMQRLLELPVTVVHGGHCGSFGRDRLREIATAYLAGRKFGSATHAELHR